MSSEFVINRRVQFVETDLAGILHFSNYYRWMEEAECAFWRSRGISMLGDAAGRAVSWPRVATSCEYYAPVRFEDELEVVLRLGDMSDRSVTYEVEFRLGRKRIAHGESTCVCCAVVEGVFEPTAIPAKYRAELERLRS